MPTKPIYNLKLLVKSLEIIILLIISKYGYCSDSTVLFKKQDITGVYKSNYDTLYMEPNKFYLKRTRPNYHNTDVVLPICYDTIAKGSWTMMSQDAIKLNNDTGFEKIDFAVNQEKRLSDDSVYFEIRLPNDDAFFEGRFEYELFFWLGRGSYDISQRIFALPKKDVSPYGSYKVTLVIKDGYPATCWPGSKCYQRIYFKVFEEFEFDNRFNYFTIKLTNFSECFVERMDIDNDFIFFKDHNIYWRGIVYEKID